MGPVGEGCGLSRLGSCLLRVAPAVQSPQRRFPTTRAGNFGMEFVRALWLGLALALGPVPAGGHPQPCGVPAHLEGSVRLGALLPRAPAARARARTALARAVLQHRLPHNLSLELVVASTPARDPASLARGLCQTLAAPGVVAVLAFPEARPELLQLHFLAAATETPVLSLLRREARAPLGAPVRTALEVRTRGSGVRIRGGPGRSCGAGTRGPWDPWERMHRKCRRPGELRSPTPPPLGSRDLGPWTSDAPRTGNQRQEPRSSGT